MATPDDVHRLICEGRIQELSELLISNPELAHVRNADNDQPIHSACWAKNIQVLGVLFAHGVDVNARGCYGRTPLQYAVHEGVMSSVPIVSVLLMRGANPNAVDDNGFTPTEWAKLEMDAGLPEVLQLLKDPYAMRGRGQGD